ncbi:MAG: helix-turn-helix transcriptional regulator [Actinomycetota bacterium]
MQFTTVTAVENARLLGPAPVRAAAGGTALSGQRAAILEQLQQQPGPATVATLAGELALHPNTVREHLDALVERGLALRERAPARGRGRPAWTYTAASGAVEPDARVREYAGLATALAGHLARTSSEPTAEALEAGRAWGRELAAAAAPEPPASAAQARRKIVALLDGLGFAPEPDARATTAALRRCPLLDAARRYPDVVCSVHLGIVRGALDVYGGDPERTDLLPFSEPGACRLHLLTRR